MDILEQALGIEVEDLCEALEGVGLECGVSSIALPGQFEELGVEEDVGSLDIHGQGVSGGVEDGTASGGAFFVAVLLSDGGEDGFLSAVCLEIGDSGGHSREGSRDEGHDEAGTERRKSGHNISQEQPVR